MSVVVADFFVPVCTLKTSPARYGGIDYDSVSRYESACIFTACLNYTEKFMPHHDSFRQVLSRGYHESVKIAAADTRRPDLQQNLCRTFDDREGDVLYTQYPIPLNTAACIVFMSCFLPFSFHYSTSHVIFSFDIMSNAGHIKTDGQDQISSDPGRLPVLFLSSQSSVS